MKKNFKLQKIMFIIYIVSMVALVLYALGFMSNYSNLFGLENPLNEDAAFFHNNVLQVFNNIIFFASLFGAITIVVMFILQINQCICDKFACVIASTLAGVMGLVCLGGLVGLPMICSIYDKTDFSFLGLEDLAFETVDYVRNFTTFYLGIGLYIIVLLAMIFFIFVICKNYRLMKKQGNEVEQHEIKATE